VQDHAAASDRVVTTETGQLSGDTRGACARRSGGFTLIDVLVSIAVIALLIGIMLPSISMVRESTRRIACSSDMRQFGLGVGMYAEDNRGDLPPSVYLQDHGANKAVAIAPHLMDTVRTSSADFRPRHWGQWDGLGVLYARAYINAPGVFYCPSHKGMSQEQDMIPLWSADAEDKSALVSNYHYRGTGPNGERRLTMIDPDAALVTDTVRSLDEINHDEGFNVLAAGLSVRWFSDTDGLVLQSITSRSDDDQGDRETLVNAVEREWTIFDGDDGVD